MAVSSKRQPSGLGALATMTGLDTAERSLAAQRLLGEQNLPLAIVAGSAAALVGAGIWAGLAVVVAFETDYIAVAVGWIVGMAVRVAGKGLTREFAVLAALLSLMACILGSLLAAAAVAAARGGVPVTTALRHFDFESARRLLMDSFHSADWLFYAFAVLESYRLARRPITRADVRAVLAGPSAPSA